MRETAVALEGGVLGTGAKVWSQLVRLVVPKWCALPHAESRRRFEGIITCSSGWGEAPLVLSCINRNFRFALILRPKAYAAPHLGSSSGRHGSLQVASRFGSALPLTSLVCFPPPTCLAADTCPHSITSQRSTRCLSWFATRPAAAAPRSSSPCRRTAFGSGAFRPIAANSSARVSPAVRRS